MNYVSVFIALFLTQLQPNSHLHLLFLAMAFVPSSCRIHNCALLWIYARSFETLLLVKPQNPLFCGDSWLTAFSNRPVDYDRFPQIPPSVLPLRFILILRCRFGVAGDGDFSSSEGGPILAFAITR
jgi:hypothetical protein